MNHIDTNVPVMSLKFRLSLFVFLYLVIYFSQPYNVFWTQDNPEYRVTSDADVQIYALKEGYLGRQICLPLLGFFGIITLFRQRRNKVCVQGFLGGLILFFLCWACLSVTWAENPFLATKRLAVLILLSTGALAVAKQFTLREIAEFTFVSGGLTVVSGLLSTVSLGMFHPFDPEYRFGGVMHPNDQAICCSMFLIAAVSLADDNFRSRLLYYSAALIAFIFLVLTKSRTAFASVIIALTFYGYLKLSRKMIVASVMFIIFSTCLLYLVVGDDLLAGVKTALFLGRMDDSTGTLNSRMPLWEECIQYAGAHPMLGYGYNSFWTAYHYSKIGTALGWGMGSAHNGYIDLVLGVGVVGASTFIVALLLAIVRSVALSVSTSSHYAFISVMLVYICLNNFLESMILLPHLSTFLLYVLLAKIGFVNNYTAIQ